jgi:hypothetical protein
MKKAIICLALVALVATGGQAIAEICAIDPVPAATVLLPYFAVDLDDAAGITTLFSLGNASAAPQLAHVTFWTDLSVPTLDFDIYLTGYDIVTVNLRDVFTDGIIPQTGGGLVPAGDFSLPNVVFPGCDLPLGNLPGILVDHIVAMHTGNQSPLEGTCGGANRGNNTAVGYITIDNVNQCNFLFPSNVGYFGTGGVAIDDNTLWGDYFLIDPANAFAQGDNLVSLEADATLELGGGGGNQGPPNGIGYTFYGRYVAATGIDHREPLATTWAARYLNGGAFTGGTSLMCWRDTGIAQQNFTCGTTPNPFPLSQEQIVVFDEDENPNLIEQPPFSPGIPGTDILPCPYEVTRVEVGGPSFPVPFDFGWLFLELSTTTGGFFDPYKQSYVFQVHDASGLFSVGYSGIALDSACQPNQTLLPVAGNVGGIVPPAPLGP